MILMHMQGTPRRCKLRRLSERDRRGVRVPADRRDQAAIAAESNRGRSSSTLGWASGKTVSHNVQIMLDTPILAGLGQPLVVGPSRKPFIGKIIGEKRPDQRVFGTAAAVAWCIANGTVGRACP